jgi:chromate transporter
VLFPAVTEMRTGPLRWYAFDPLAIDVKVSLLAIIAALLAFVLHRSLLQLVAIMACLGIAVRLLS